MLSEEYAKKKVFKELLEFKILMENMSKLRDKKLRECSTFGDKLSTVFKFFVLNGCIITKK